MIATAGGPASGLLFPSRLDLADFVWVAKGREVLDTRLVLTYDDYRFFYTSSQEKVEPPAKTPQR